MPTYKTRAIILSSYPYREHDRIVSFYSEDYGLLSARARGCRKLASKLAGHLEPFIETELLLARGRRWDILAGSRTTRPQARVRGQLELAAAAAVCCEAVKLISKPMAPDGRVWEMLRENLSVLSLERRGDAVYRFLWRLLSFSGFAPEMKKCIHCRREIQGFPRHPSSRWASGLRVARDGNPPDCRFSREGGGVLCPDCCQRDPLAVKMEKEDIAALAGQRAVLSRDARQVVIDWWRTVVSHAPLRSLEFWETL